MVGKESSTPQLGTSIPPHTAHAISVSLPTWKDNIDYGLKDKRVVEVMTTGYPRFLIHKSIEKLMRISERSFGTEDERCLIFPSENIARHCRDFVRRHVEEPILLRLFHLPICGGGEPRNYHERSKLPATPGESVETPTSCEDLFIVFFPASASQIAKQFWTHTGLGISSRRAERCLSLLPTIASADDPSFPACSETFYSLPQDASYRHCKSASCLFTKNSFETVPPSSKSSLQPLRPWFSSPPSSDVIEAMKVDPDVYIEERNGQNLPLSLAFSAKRILRRRIASGYQCHELIDHNGGNTPNLNTESKDEGIDEGNVESVNEDDVYLFPSGMAAIWTAHQVLLNARPPGKSVCFGFLYVDTIRTLQNWGPGCHFFGFGDSSDIDKLEALVSSSPKLSVLALFTEIPSNPLLRTADLVRLRTLADKYDFLIVIDDTIGNFVNVQVLSYADIVVSSLSKIFSGGSNVMGGSLLLNPTRKHYFTLKATLERMYEDTYFSEDAIYMEQNSRNYVRRIRTINARAETLYEYLLTRLHDPINNPHSVLKKVYYPKNELHEGREMNYTHLMTPAGSYGSLLSLTFTSLLASGIFYDSLQCTKGPSLGTNFTLVCAYSILAHFSELDWAKEFGVEEGLIRASVGMDGGEGWAVQVFGSALDEAERACECAKLTEGL